MAQILDENLYFVSNPCIWEWSWFLEKYFGFEILELCIILWGTVVLYSGEQWFLLQLP